MSMLKMFTIVTLVSAVGCSKQVAVETPPPPPPEPAPVEPVAEAEPEEEAEPVMATEPKNLEIQRDVIRLKPGIRILFATNSDQLLEPSFEILDEVASVFEQNARLRVRVEGHTDADGNAKHNMDLSGRRAASVMKYLTDKGVAAERLESQGCGQNVPIGDNKTEDGKQLNRRVEFVILRRRRAVEPCREYRPRERGERRRRGEGGDGAPAPGPAAPST
jgi:OmpA-OmpF porin, OOP family